MASYKTKIARLNALLDAQAEMLREQKPVAWRHENGNIFLPWQKDLIVTGAVFSPLFAAPVPAPHPGATHCDDCGLTWLDDGLNPLWCPYCKESVPAPAVPAEIIELSKKYAIDTEAYHAAMDALLQSVPAPAVPKEWRRAVSEFLSSHDAAWAELFKSLPADTRSVTVSNHQADAVRKANALRALLQSAPQAPAVPKLQLQLATAVIDYIQADDAMHAATRRTGFGGMGKPVETEAVQRQLAGVRHAARERLYVALNAAQEQPQ